MPHTKEQIIKMIDLDEPEYPAIIAKFDESDIPILTELVKDPNMAIATKAVSCLGFMKTTSAVDGIKIATEDKNPILRVAAAHSLQNLSKLPEAVKLIDKLLDDKDIGVRKFALKTVDAGNIKSLKGKIEKVEKAEKNELLKNLSQQILKKL